MSKLFTPITLGNKDIRNRIVMPPMCQYTAGSDGIATEWHIVHYTTRAVGGVGLIIVEATAIEPRGRITDNDLGLWSDEQIPMLKRIVENVQAQGAKIGIQLGHAGRKSRSLSGSPVAPSPIPFSSDYRTPIELSLSGIKDIQHAFITAAARAFDAGFDLIEIHAAHGYLINEFLSPMTNKRKDEYGGSLENRTRIIAEILTGIREELPEAKPISVRISAVDHIKGGMELNEMIDMIGLLKDKGVDIWHVSSGGISDSRIETYPGYQVRYSREIRSLDVKTIAVGEITAPEHAEAIVSEGSADMIALGRELLRNPYWPLMAAYVLGADITWPRQYERARKER